MLETLLVRIRHILFTCVFIISATVLPLVMSQPAEASLYVCRGDPIISLSDGFRLTFTVDLTVPASRVASVVYTVHAPARIKLHGVKYPVDALSGKESVIFLNDSPDAAFHVTTIAHLFSGANGAVLVTGVNKKLRVTATGLTEAPISVTMTAVK
jgi:hypothetical protein